MPFLPPITQALLLVNVGLFFLDRVVGGGLTPMLMLWPIGAFLFRPWQPFTYAFAHADFEHLFFNMVGLWFLGSELERSLGERRYLVFYSLCALGGALLHLLLAPALGLSGAMLGASGAVLGLTVGFALLNPRRRISLILPPISMQARTMALIYAVLEIWAILPSWVPGVAMLDYLFGSIAHLAHLGGMLAGALAIRYWQRRSPFGWR